MPAQIRNRTLFFFWALETGAITGKTRSRFWAAFQSVVVREVFSQAVEESARTGGPAVRVFWEGSET